VWASTSHAEEKVFRVGLMPAISTFNIIDPFGPTATGNGFSLLNAVGILDVGRDSRLIGSVGYDKFTLGASASNIGQDVARTGGSVSYQSMFRFTREFKPWVGVGLGVASESYKTRYTLSSGGNSVPASPPERSVNNIFAVLNISTEWQVNKTFDMGVHLQYEHPSGDGTKTLRIGIYIVH